MGNRVLFSSAKADLKKSAVNANKAKQNSKLSSRRSFDKLMGNLYRASGGVDGKSYSQWSRSTEGAPGKVSTLELKEWLGNDYRGPSSAAPDDAVDKSQVSRGSRMRARRRGLSKLLKMGSKARV